MKWYLAKMVFRIICGDGEHTPQFDEQLRLVAGINKEEAVLKAREMGQREEEAFYNTKEQLVQWQFINVSELYLLNELIDGVELYSRIEIYKRKVPRVIDIAKPEPVVARIMNFRNVYRIGDIGQCLHE